jgi:hypothetical protein
MALALRLPFDTRPFYGIDEAVFALGARAIVEGGLVYHNVWDHRGPLLHHVYGRDARAIDLWQNDLARSRPRLTVDGHRSHEWSWPYPLTRFPAVWRLVEAEYRVSRTVGPVVIYERTTP